MRWYEGAYKLRYASLRYFNAGARPALRRAAQHPNHISSDCLAGGGGLRPHVEIYGDDYPTRDGTCVRDYSTSLTSRAHTSLPSRCLMSARIYNSAAARRLHRQRSD